MQQQVFQGFRLSPQQKHLWLMQQAGNMPEWVWGQVLIEGQFDKSALKKAIREIVDKHEILRTTFRHLPGMQVPLQVITDAVDEMIVWEEESNLRHLSELAQRAHIETMMEGESSASVIAGATSLRLSLLELADNQHLLLIRLPALCADEATIENLVFEVKESYAALLGEEKAEDEPMQYVVASEWLNSLLESDSGAAGKRFWRAQDYKGLQSLRLPFEGMTEFNQPFHVESFNSFVDSELTAQLTAIAEKYETTLPVLLLGCWQILLAQLTGQTDILVGTAFDGRTDEEMQRALGLFTKYLPVNSRLEPDSRLRELLPHLDEAVLAASEWQECFSWEEIASGNIETDDIHFFPYCFNFKPEPVRHAVKGTTFSLVGQTVNVERFHLQLSCSMQNGSLQPAFQYDVNFYDTNSIERLAGEFQALLRSLAKDPEVRLDTLEILSDIERKQMLIDFNDTAVDYGQNICLHELVVKQATRTPNHIAIEFEGQQLSYSELNERANQVAHYLRKQGVGPDTLVGLCVERSLEMIVGMLGILKAGGAYVPLNPSLPLERITFMIDDAKIKILLSEKKWRNLLQGCVAEVTYLDEDWERISSESQAEPVSGVTTDNLAYVIYTSGSTGMPKGVMISHHAINNRLLWAQTTYPLSETDSLLQKTVFNFDASVWEFFVPLLAGAKVVMARPDGHQDSAYLVKMIAEHQVTTLQMVPSMLRILLEEPQFKDCTSLKNVFCGGEAFPIGLQEQFYDILDADLHNLYGPTEVAIDATSWDCERGSDYGVTRGLIPIGRPLSNVKVYLLDKHMRPTPFGMPGEIYVSGFGLARGYLSRPELTAEKFVPNPFSQEPGARLYRTGDLGRFLPNLTIEFLGRTDYQVKLRGFRIELGEIEAALRNHPAVKESVAIVREDEPGNQQLVAYVVPASHREASDSQADFQYYRLPNNLEIAHLNKSETDWLYQEIFTDLEYLKHGINFADGDCVFDVGANIGLFTLYTHMSCKNATVYSFEPSPPTFAVMKENVELYGLNVKPYQCAISDKARIAEFTFYPKVSASSGLYANVKDDANVTREFIKNQGEFDQYADELLEGRFEAVTYQCQLRTISEIIRENAISRIDLLKVDVEKSELDVLRGIAEEDWPKIKQVVMEIHDSENRLELICELLREHGFEFDVDQHESLQHTGLYNLYAVHPSRRESQQDKPFKPQSNTLVAHNGMHHLSSSELRQYLSEKVPEYMVPATFVTLDTLPLTSNGKIDRQALPAPSETHRQSSEQKNAPQTPVQELIAGIWSKLLGIEQVDIQENFFDMGGHSLLATQVVSRLREAFQSEIPLRTVFESPTVEGLARNIENFLSQETGLALPPIRAYERDQYAPLSYAQQRIWFLDQLAPGNFFFNVPVAFRLIGTLDQKLLEDTLNEVIKRHETLRTTFTELTGQPMQFIAEHLKLEIQVQDLSDLPQAEQEAKVREFADAEAQLPFNLSTGPLLRAKLLRLSAEEHVALFTMHHIISDGWSMGVLVKEVMTLYQALSTGDASTLEELPIQYADYARWQKEWLQGEALEKHLTYWRNQLSEKLETLELPTDYPRPSVQTYKGTTRSLTIPGSLTDSLKVFSKQESATFFMTLLSAFAVLLHRYSGQENIAIGTDVANRNKTDLEKLIGFFVNQLLLRVDLSDNPSFRELLARVRETTLAAYAHQELPFDKLVEDLRPARDTSRSPLFQVKFALQNAPIQSLELPGLVLSPVEFDGGKANLDLTLFIRENEQGMTGLMEYNTELFSAATIDRMLANFELLLTGIANDPDVSVHQLKEALDASESEYAEAEKKKLAESSFKKFKSIVPKSIQVSRKD